MGIADDLGILDDSFGQQSVEDQLDVAENPDPMQFLSEEQLVSLVDKFVRIPEPQRSQIEQKLKAELPPQVSQRLDAVLRFGMQRGAGQV